MPAFGRRRLDQVTAQAFGQWRTFQMTEGKLPQRTAVKVTTILHGIFEHARAENGFGRNPVDDVPKLTMRYDPDSYEWYEPEEVWALVRGRQGRAGRRDLSDGGFCRPALGRAPRVARP